MTQSSQDTFVDRRTEQEQEEGFATQILFWYDTDKKKRRRVNGIAITTDGNLVVARSTCSKKDQFVKVHGRMIVTKRIFGRAKTHCWELMPYYVTEAGVATTSTPFSSEGFDINRMAEACATVYAERFPNDDKGHKRAFNAGKIFTNYRADLDSRANELLDGFDGQPTA